MMQLGAEGVFVGSGIFKSEDPGAARAGDRRGDDALRRPRARRRASRGPRRGDGVARDAQARPTSSCSPSAAGRPRAAASACSRSRAASRRTRGCCAALGASVREVRVPADLDGLDGLVHPRRRVDDDDARHRARGPGRAAARARRRRDAGARHVRRADHARPRAPRDAWTSRRERNAFGRQVRSFEADLEIDGIEGRRCARSSSARPWIAEHGAGRRDPRERRRPSGRRAPGSAARGRRSIPSWAATRALHERFLAACEVSARA